MPLFSNRREGGQKLAAELSEYADRPDVVVLGLPRGGVPVAFEVAEALKAPLDVFVVRKLGVPGHEELAMGAIASGGVRTLNERVVQQVGITQDEIDAVAERERRELERRERDYRPDRPQPELRGKTVLLVDDGLATGASMRAAVEGLRQHEPARIVVAVPTASAESCASFENLVDETVCAATPRPFRGVGYWYQDFSQTQDAEVRALLRRAAEREVAT